METKVSPSSAIARQLLASYDLALPIDPAELAPIDNLDDARDIVDDIAAARVGRGERRLGYKIGFTNRTIWARYGVNHPIWAPVYDSTVRQLAGHDAAIGLTGLVEPRLEPEIVIGLASTPLAPTAQAVARSVGWIAAGFEIVQSAFPGWQFTGAQAFAAQGLHGRLLIGPRHSLASLGLAAADLPAQLAAIELALFANGAARPTDTGRGHYVLDGPCHALAHLVAELACAGRQLDAGDIITTGTLTDAQPLASGQRWRSEIQGIPGLQGLTLRIEAA
ncbi:MAG: hypothetical protein R3E68_05375 [Burkholderiaceae bacterium]